MQELENETFESILRTMLYIGDRAVKVAEGGIKAFFRYGEVLNPLEFVREFDSTDLYRQRTEVDHILRIMFENPQSVR